MFQAIFGKIDEFGSWDLEIISADAGTQFTSTEFQDECQTCVVRPMLAALENQEMNRQLEEPWRTLRSIAYSLMVHAQVSQAYIHFALMYTAYYKLPILPIKDLINKDVKPNTQFKLATGTKPSISYLHVLFCPCVVQKSTAHVGTKALNMRHQVKRGFCDIFIGIPHHQTGYFLRTPQMQDRIFVRCCF